MIYFACHSPAPVCLLPVHCPVKRKVITEKCFCLSLLTSLSVFSLLCLVAAGTGGPVMC